MIWLELCLVYLKIGILGFGGGYAMLSLIQADVVDRYGWISLQEFTDIVAISQMTPGPIGINSATYIGYTAIHNAGYSMLVSILGSCLTTFSVCLPSFLLVLLIALCFTQVKDNVWVEKAFKGLRPAVVALIAAPCLTTARSIKLSYKQLVIPVGAALLIWLVGVSPAWIILAAIVGGLVYGLNKRKEV